MSTMTLEELQWEIKFLKTQADLLTARCQVLSAKSKAALNRREWVGLTDQELGTLTVFEGLHHVEVPALVEFVRTIEAALKERNT